MNRSPAFRTALGAALLLSALHSAPALAGPVQYWGNSAELSVSAITDRTVQIVVAPLDDKSEPKPGAPSTALVEQKPQLRLRTRELAGPANVVAGKLRVQVKQDPLTFTV